MDGLRLAGRVNPKQLKVLEAAESLKRKLCCIAGPPGTGKTRSLRQLVVGLRLVGHKTLVTASLNVAVDHNATAVFENMPRELRDKTKMLRIEVGSVEAHSMLTQQNYFDYSGIEETDLVKYKKLSEATDNTGLVSTVGQMVAELSAYGSMVERIRGLESLDKRVDDIGEMFRIV